MIFDDQVESAEELFARLDELVAHLQHDTMPPLAVIAFAIVLPARYEAKKQAEHDRLNPPLRGYRDSEKTQ